MITVTWHYSWVQRFAFPVPSGWSILKIHLKLCILISITPHSQVDQCGCAIQTGPRAKSTEDSICLDKMWGNHIHGNFTAGSWLYHSPYTWRFLFSKDPHLGLRYLGLVKTSKDIFVKPERAQADIVSMLYEHIVLLENWKIYITNWQVAQNWA